MQKRPCYTCPALDSLSDAEYLALKHATRESRVLTPTPSDAPPAEPSKRGPLSKLHSLFFNFLTKHAD